MVAVVDYVAATALHGQDLALKAPEPPPTRWNGCLHPSWWSRSYPGHKSPSRWSPPRPSQSPRCSGHTSCPTAR